MCTYTRMMRKNVSNIFYIFTCTADLLHIVIYCTTCHGKAVRTHHGTAPRIVANAQSNIYKNVTYIQLYTLANASHMVCAIESHAPPRHGTPIFNIAPQLYIAHPRNNSKQLNFYKFI